MSPTLMFQFDLHDGGWARASFVRGPATYHFAVSYLNDSPRDVIEACVRLLRGSPEERVVFVEEPGENVLILTPRPGGGLNLRIFFGEDDDLADVHGKPAFEREVPLNAFARTVHDVFAGIRREIGVREYRRRWMLYDFPAEPLAELRALID